MSQAGLVAEHPVLAGARAASDGLGDACDGTVWQLGDDEVETSLEVLQRVEAQLLAARGGLLREAVARDLRSRTQALTTPGWVADRFRITHQQATARLRDGQALLRHPALADALAAGAVNVAQAKIVIEVFDRLDDLGLDEPTRQAAQRFLLEQTHALGPRDLTRAGQALLEALTRRPSVDDPSEAAAVRAELD
ncbi:MAG: DUF222 domain-containing protein, partial [Actinomycetes bacterium]